MSRSLSRTLRGHAAIRAFLDWLAPEGGDWGPPEALRGAAVRNAYASHQAVLAFLADLRARGARRVWLRPEPDEEQQSLLLAAARFRPDQGDPDDGGDAGTFGFGTHRVSLEGIRVRMSAPGVLEMWDREGGSATFGTSPDALFDETLWDTDQWDLPAPVPPIVIAEDALARFAPQATAIAADVIATRPTDHAEAESAMVAHWAACSPYGSVPAVCWFPSPGAALDAMAAARVGSSNLRRDLRERPLVSFDQEIAVRLTRGDAAPGYAVERETHGSAVVDAVWRMTSDALGHDMQRALLDRIVSSRDRAGFDSMGLVADHARLGYYAFLRANGAQLSDAAATFAALTASVWLMFPTRSTVFAVERPTAVEASEDGLTLLFSDGDRLPVPAT